MKLKRFLMTSCLAAVSCSLSTAVLAANEFGHGRVAMQGSIVDTACAIAMADRDQSIDIGTITTGEILHDGQGPDRDFHLGLVNCSLRHSDARGTEWSRFQVTFDGTADGKLFAVHGAEGVGLEIRDASGHLAIPGQPMPAGALSAGGEELSYRVHLQDDHHRLRAREFRSTIRFKVDYY